MQVVSVGADSLRRLIDKVLADPAYNARVVTDPWAPVRRAWAALTEWVDRLRATNPTAYNLMVWALVAVLAAIVLHAFWVAARTMRAGVAPQDRAAPEAAAPARDAGWYERESQRLALEGRYAEAMQADFLRLVLELDAREVTRFHPAKTPGEYLGDARLTPEGRERFRSLVHRLYLHAFARVGADRTHWEEWQGEARPDAYARAH